MKLATHLSEQIAFSIKTFGPGSRTAGVTDHIRQELEEVITAKTHDEKIKEWVDVVLLSFDGLWRAIANKDIWTDREISDIVEEEEIPIDEIAQTVEEKIRQKFEKNQRREWPDWRTAPLGKAITHTKGIED